MTGLLLVTLSFRTMASSSCGRIDGIVPGSDAIICVISPPTLRAADSPLSGCENNQRE